MKSTPLPASWRLKETLRQKGQMSYNRGTVKFLYLFLDWIRDRTRTLMHFIAVGLNAISGGRLSPNAVTIIGLLMHGPIAWLIATNHYLWAAVLLLVFGLFDTLDGELARLQKRANAAGMLLDASTDRLKEVLLYSGVGYALASSTSPGHAAWAVAACGFSLCVSYVKAKGETAVSGSHLTPNEVNRLFQDGLLRFEVRMFLLIIGLVLGQLAWATIVIAILSAYTAIQRLVSISRKLSDVPD
jgi:phosphatidylglycerophosphate synthase